MPRLIVRSISEPVRPWMPWKDLWEGADDGVIAAWERGRQYARENTEVAAAALRGELPVLPWKGGIDRPVRGRKFGCLYYLAMWQGLRGDDLNIGLEAEVTHRCSKTATVVTFTGDLKKYSPEGA